MIKCNINLQKEKQLNLGVEKGRGIAAMNQIFYALSIGNFISGRDIFCLVTIFFSAQQMRCYRMRAVTCNC